MKLRLLEWLVCPACSSTFTAETFVAEGEDIRQGSLHCHCEVAVPVVDSIPRFLDDWPEQFPNFVQQYGKQLGAASGTFPAHASRFQRWQKRTRHSFGYQWTAFGRMVCDFRKNFLSYIHPLKPQEFPGKLGLDVGCGFGRHIFNAAGLGAEMVGVDLSRAIDVAAHHTQALSGVHLIQADLYHLPLRPATFDFVYSLGVLHHLPDPQRGFNAIVPLAKPNGHVAVWLYSSSRRFTNAGLEIVRFFTRALPLPFLRGLSYVAAALDWVGFILPYKLLRRLPGIGRVVERLSLPRIKVYAEYPFQVGVADWFDRLSAPIRYYYGPEDVRRWFEQAGLTGIQVSPTGLYGWRGCGCRPSIPVDAVLEPFAPLARGIRAGTTHDECA